MYWTIPYVFSGIRPVYTMDLILHHETGGKANFDEIIGPPALFALNRLFLKKSQSLVARLRSLTEEPKREAPIILSSWWQHSLIFSIIALRFSISIRPLSLGTNSPRKALFNSPVF